MKRLLTCFVVLLCAVSSRAQEQHALNTHRIAADFGSYRNRYLYAITDLHYKSPLSEKLPLAFSARIRSYGTLFFFTKTAYDITPQLAYFFTREPKLFYLSAGAGVDARLRFSKDERSDAVSSAEPLVFVTAHSSWKKLRAGVPLWTRFYSNGISFSLQPEVAWQFSSHIAAFARYEWSYLRVYKNTTSEWRRDCFVGAAFSF
jgi:hypothetical protein